MTSDPHEAVITINGRRLSTAQAMTLRVVVSGRLLDSENLDALGTDEHGRAMVRMYREQLSEIQDLIFQNLG